jgi:ATP-dependent DNA helicase RecQ
VDDINVILKKYWGFDEFRPLQKEIIESVLNGNDTLAILPTGGGKSICFQVPALATTGICLVISPLIALMKDQVENLKRKGIPALMIHSGMSRKDVIRILKNASGDYFKFLYVSPERLETSLFKEFLPAISVNLIAVDEAHCISQWGYDFRPPYLKIAELRKEIPNAPILALTASATIEVQNDIVQNLLFRERQIYKQSFERQNLSYKVKKTESKVNSLLEILKNQKGSCIIYCKSRKRTQEISNLLNMHGLKSEFYHAGLQQSERNKKQQLWIENKVPIIVCTNAFGMGIDKPDVRAVIHMDVPECLENYYQESGRAGRDGNSADAFLLFNDKDPEDLQNNILIKFPSIEVITTVYQSLCNFLQVAENSGAFISYAFYFDIFCRNFKLKSLETYNALKVLELDGWISFKEENLTPSTLCFQTNKNELYQFEDTYPHYEPLLTTLLRTYEGIFDYPTSISESYIATILRKQEHEIKQLLKEISKHGIISYTPKNEEPQMQFLKNRVAVKDFTINTILYEKRKVAYKKRVDGILNYVQSNSCRSQIINNYFGEVQLEKCGICDNCIQKKVKRLNKDEFNHIYISIKDILSTNSITIKELIEQLSNTEEENIWEVIEFLQSENKIHSTENGSLYLHK